VTGLLTARDDRRTFQYMAPEQLEGRNRRADRHLALGCVLYEMARGRERLGEEPASLIAAIMDYEPPSITEMKPLAPAAWSTR